MPLFRTLAQPATSTSPLPYPPHLGGIIALYVGLDRHLRPADPQFLGPLGLAAVHIVLSGL
jgi:hypothetical protein